MRNQQINISVGESPGIGKGFATNNFILRDGERIPVHFNGSRWVTEEGEFVRYDLVQADYNLDITRPGSGGVGRSRKLTKDQIQLALKLRIEGLTLQQIADRIGSSQSNVHKVLQGLRND